MTDQPPAVPESPGSDLSGALADAARQREQEALAQSEAIANMVLLLEGLQQEITALLQESAEHEGEIRHLTAAMLSLPCPERKNDPTVKDEAAIASISTCLSCDMCDCNAGQQIAIGLDTYGGVTAQTT